MFGFSASLTAWQRLLFSTVAFLIVAFGQPAYSFYCSLAAATIGYTLFFRVLIDLSSAKKRFILGFFWFFCVQLVHMSWFLSHPFLYIIAVYLFIATWLGAQFGCISLLLRREVIQYSLPRYLFFSAMVSSCWAILEWSRLYLLSGLSWNPAGLALTASVYGMQAASIGGIFFLSFIVIFTNLLALRILGSNSIFSICKGLLLWGVIALAPYIYGAIKIAAHHPVSNQTLKVLLVQPAFPIEESGDHSKGILALVQDEWSKIISIITPYHGQEIDLIVLPEYVVPFSTKSPIFPLHEVMAAFHAYSKSDDLTFLPELGFPYTFVMVGPNGIGQYVSNAYWMQAIANYFHADVIAGLEDSEGDAEGKVDHYSSAQFTHPEDDINAHENFSQRYAKRVLVPMGEYIPFAFCRNLAESYGVFGSFTAGKEAVVMTSHGVNLSPSICYEETYGDIIREGRQRGAQLLVNLTSDVWYPNSMLPQQHFDHARLRTVENGIPLVRACNTGITGAVDSFGRNIAIYGGDNPQKFEWAPGALLVTVPIDTYTTFYSKYGDRLIIGLSLFLAAAYLIFSLIPSSRPIR